MNPAELVKCPCRTCTGNVEFEACYAGNIIDCPHCGAQTGLYIPLKTCCRHCKRPIEFPADLLGNWVECPHCQLETKLEMKAPTPVPVVASAPPAAVPATVLYAERKNSDWVGIGCVVQFVGVILLFFFPIGTIFGIILLMAGGIYSRKKICSECGAQIMGRKTSHCRACGAAFLK